MLIILLEFGRCARHHRENRFIGFGWKKNQDKILISAPAREKTGRSGARTSDAATQSHRSNQAFLIIIRFSWTLLNFV